jgi:hypothetical protein
MLKALEFPKTLTADKIEELADNGEAAIYSSQLNA